MPTADAIQHGQFVIDEAVLRLARVFSQEHSRREPEWQVLHVHEQLQAENEPLYSRLNEERPASRLICSRSCELEQPFRPSPYSRLGELQPLSSRWLCSRSGELQQPSRSSPYSHSGE